MLNKRNNIGISISKSTSIYVGLQFLQRASILILIPIYVEYFSVFEFGYFSLLNSLKAFFAIFCTLNLESAALTYYFNFEENDSLAIKNYLANLFTLAIYIGSGVLLLGMLLGSHAFSFLLVDQSIIFYPYGMIILITAVVSSLNQIFFIYLKNKEDLKLYSKLLSVLVVTNVLFQVLLVVVWDFNFIGALTGILLSNTAVLLYIIFQNSWLINLRVSKRAVTDSLKYCIKLIPFLLIQWILSLGDRVLIERFFDVEMIGQYSMMINIAMILSMVANAYLTTIRNKLYRSFNSLSNSRTVLKYFLNYCGLLLLIAILVFSATKLLNAYFENAGYLYLNEIIALGILIYLIRSLVRFFNEYLIHQKHSGDLSWLSFINLTVLAGLIFWSLHEMTIERFLLILIVSNAMLLVLTFMRTYYLYFYQRKALEN